MLVLTRRNGEEIVIATSVLASRRHRPLRWRDRNCSRTALTTQTEQPCAVYPPSLRRNRKTPCGIAVGDERKKVAKRVGWEAIRLG
jgi:hypothetical protein